MELRRVATYASVLLCFGTAPAFARTLVVDNDGAECRHAEYNTIQQAVAAAQAGDRILVCPGLYLGTVVVETSHLRIEARGAPGEVVLQGTGAVGELGFVLLNTTGVVLQGFTAQGFGRAQIRIQGGRGNTVRKNVIRDAVVNDGIQVTSSSANLVELNTSYGNLQDGIFIGQIAGISGEPASNNTIRYNETFNNRFGIHLNGSGPGNVIFGNRSHDNTQRGIVNQNLSHGTEIKYNHVSANGLTAVPGVAGVGVGINVANNSSLVTVRNNRTEGNGASGITLTNAANNVVTHNLSDNNAASGVQLNAATSSVVEKNWLVRNLDGVRMFSNAAVNPAAANVIQSNYIWRSGRDGIRAEVTSSDNRIERNIVVESVEHDAHDDSVGSGTAGTANFWVNNHCGTENRLVLCDQ